jgi:hypothetical protein
MLDVHNKIKELSHSKKGSIHTLDPMMIKHEDHHQVPWNKLDKSIKINKLNAFADEFKELHDLNDDQVVQLKVLLKDKINHKYLQKSKDVVYDIETGIVKSIPNLSYISPLFIFKSLERASPLNSLTPKNKTIRHNK